MQNVLKFVLAVHTVSTGSAANWKQILGIKIKEYILENINIILKMCLWFWNREFRKLVFVAAQIHNNERHCEWFTAPLLKVNKMTRI
jgi:hypothetical protein